MLQLDAPAAGLHTKASVVASTRSLVGGTRFHLALLVAIEDGYWVPVTPPGGGVELALSVRPPPGFRMGPVLVPRGVALRVLEGEPGYEGLTALFVEVEAPASLAPGDRLSFAVEGEWTACNARKCRIEAYDGLAFFDVESEPSEQGFDWELSELLSRAAPSTS